MGFLKNFNFSKLKDGLSKTRDKLVTKLTETISGKAKIDDATLDEVEEILITSDIGLDLASSIVESARTEMKKISERDKLNLVEFIKQELINKLSGYGNFGIDLEQINNKKPFVILIVGVNGAGKTTTIGKLAYNYKNNGLKVIIGSADTFRAAANEQLEIWAKRADVEIVQSSNGSDPSAVAYDTINRAIEAGADIVIIDTAGRLHTKNNLMQELGKIKRVLNKVLQDAPNETLLVLDGNTGQNALIQAREFNKVTEITGLIITKLDGTSKGGAIFQICEDKKIPVKYIGVGEGIEDLQTFEPTEFVNALFARD